MAKGLVKGIVRGDFYLPNPDLGLNLHARGHKGMMPRSFPGILVDMLLGCILPIVYWFHAGGMDKTARKHASKRFMSLWQRPCCPGNGPQ